MSTDLDAELETAIEGIQEMTAQLERLRGVRADFVRVYGRARSRETFVYLDRSLRALRKAAR